MLLDTSGLLCLLNKSEAFHHAAIEYYASTTIRITHSLVLAELIALCTVRNLPRPAVLQFIQALLDNPDIEVLWADFPMMTAAYSLLQNRVDKTYSWCDAVSFVIMSQRGLSEALTTDRHFDQEGFHRLLI